MNFQQRVDHKSRLYRAYHEAGHCAAAYLSGARVDFLELFPEGGGRCRVLHDGAAQQALCIAAGGYAVELLLYKAGRLFANELDKESDKAFIDLSMANAWDDKKSFFGGDRSEDERAWPPELDTKFMTFGWKEVSPLLAPWMQAIEALAIRLEAESKLTGQEALTVLVQHGFQPQPPSTSMANPVVVHLVHGTWPYGPFRKRPPSELDATRPWFDSASAFAGELYSRSREAMIFESFHWTGKQSMGARAKASEEFLDHLQNCVAKYGDAQHIIVAHSHGGTVVANALMNSASLFHNRVASEDSDRPAFSDLMGTVSKVKAVVCLASPFTYISSNTAHARTIRVALSTLTGALGSVAAILLYPALIERLTALSLLFAYLSLVLPALVAVIQLTMLKSNFLPALNPIPANIKVFLIRATNDEAALIIGLGQSIGWILRLFYQPFIDDGKRSLIPGACAIALLLLGAWLLPAALGFNELTFGQRLVVSFAIIPGSFGALFLFGCIFLGLALGVLDPKYWMLGEPTADPTPPGIPCSFKSYSELYFPKPVLALRHGIYDDPRVQDDIVQIIRCVAQGNDIELQREAELRKVCKTQPQGAGLA